MTKEPNKTFIPRLTLTLSLETVMSFLQRLKNISLSLGTDFLLNLSSDCDVDAADANIITYKQPINMIKTWIMMTNDIIAKNANNV